MIREMWPSTDRKSSLLLTDPAHGGLQPCKRGQHSRTRSRRFLECICDFFLSFFYPFFIIIIIILQVIEQPTRKDAPMDLVLTSNVDLLGMGRSKAALAAGNVRWWSSGS